LAAGRSEKLSETKKAEARAPAHTTDRRDTRLEQRGCHPAMAADFAKKRVRVTALRNAGMTLVS